MSMSVTRFVRRVSLAARTTNSTKYSMANTSSNFCYETERRYLADFDAPAVENHQVQEATSAGVEESDVHPSLDPAYISELYELMRTQQRV